MIKERIIQLIEYKGIPKEKFYKEIGVTSANFRGKAKLTPLNSSAIENIITIIPDVNLRWLLTGEGEMLKGPEQAVRAEKPPPPAQDPRDTYIIELQKKQIAFLEQEINAYKSRLKECEQRELRAAELAMERKRKLEQSGEKTK